MKTTKFIYIVFVNLLLFNLMSCGLAGDLDDIEPLFTLDADNAINSEDNAELALIGVYSGFRQSSFSSGTPDLYFIPSLMSGLLINAPNSNITLESKSYADNNPDATSSFINHGAYSRMYDIINRTNWLIEKVSLLGEDKFPTSGRKKEILGEAKAIRATANFYLLRLWGQFYDVDSKYGITIRTKPSRSATAFPRNSVAEVYKIIIEDLDDAIGSAPDLRAKFFANKIYAKGLKAKVLLYKGDYAAAAVLAKDVLDNAGGSFVLATDYTGIFKDHTTTDLFNSSDILFASKGEPQEGLGLGLHLSSQRTVSPDFSTFGEKTTTIGGQKITFDASRISSTTYSIGSDGLGSYKYVSGSETADKYEMLYHLRIAEVYLIFAEAEARAKNSVTTDALNALNKIRERAGATTTGADGFETYPATITLPEFLEAVRIEKYIELSIENGEEWFDLVRYHFVDGFDVTKVKPTATDPTKYILPYSSQSVTTSGGVVEQNPNY